MLKTFYRFSSLNRNFFQISPSFPDKEFLLHRPHVATMDKVLNQQRQLYNRRVNKIVQSIKNKNIVESKMSPKEFQIKRRQQWDDLISNIYLDPETNSPMGLMFDDFILQIKQERGQKYELEYNKRMKTLLKQMKAMNENELLNMSKYLTAENESDEYMAKARTIIFNNLKEQLKTNKELFSQYFDEESRELALTAIKEQNEDSVTALLKQEKVQEMADKLSLDNLNQELKIYAQMTQKSDEQKQNKLDFYESPVTESDVSDDEKLFGTRLNRRPSGMEIFETKQSIQEKVITDQIKRTYLKKLKQPESEEFKQPQILEETMVNNFFVEDNESYKELREKIQTINKNLKDDLSFEQVKDQLDFLLLNAPQFIKDKIKDPNNQYKKFESTFLGNEQQSLLWKDFEDTFQTVFPALQAKKSKQKINTNSGYQNMEQMFQEIKPQQKEDTFSIELYKEFKKPQNVEFFTHYLTNTFRANRDAINSGIQSIYSDQHQYMMDLPKKSLLIEEEEIENKQEELLEKDEEINESELQKLSVNIMVDYSEASLLSYQAQGKRKTCVCEVTIKKGFGNVTINGKNLIHYFPHPYHRRIAMRPIELSQLSCFIDVDILIRGSSTSSQSEAICVGLSRAISKMCPSIKPYLRKLRLTRTDHRQVERKKIGLYKARKKYPYSRR